MTNLSALIITKNEEENILRCLNSLEGLVDEVILVDSQSIDKTQEIAKQSGAKVFERKFDNFSNQRNFGLLKAQGKWVLSIDADEVIPEDLADEIKKAIEKKEVVGYLIPRRNFILGREIKHSRWSPDKHIWLWRKDQGAWKGNVHEEVVVKGAVSELKNAKLHYSYKTIKDFFNANNFYSQFEAEELYRNKIKYSFWKMSLSSIYEFILRYFLKLGYLDGVQGFILCYLMGVYKLSVWIKLWELQTKAKL